MSISELFSPVPPPPGMKRSVSQNSFSSGEPETNTGRFANLKDPDSPKRPRTKPRSIFLTPSMEDLEVIGRGQGGGSGAPGTAV